MQLPSLLTVDGAYDYLIGFLLLLAFLFALYVVGSYFNVVPGPSELVPGVLVAHSRTVAETATLPVA